MNAVEQAQFFLQDWLARADWRTNDLECWLVDQHFPLPDTDEPFVWLLRGLPDGNRDSDRALLAKRVAALLWQKPDLTAKGDTRPRLLYNLFSLCAGLAYHREEIGPPLFKIYERQRDELVLRESYQDILLSNCLRAALSLNQTDRKLRPEWIAMMDGKPNFYLPGNVFDGLQGFTWLPPTESRDSWGEPAILDLGIALFKTARYVSHLPSRRAVFRLQIERIIRTYPGREWGYELLMEADRTGWPDWTAECLPCLWIDRDDSVIIWMGIAGRSFAEHFPEDVKARYMSSKFLQIQKRNPLLSRLERTVAQIEAAIDDRPGMSENEYRAQDRHMYQECDYATRAEQRSGAGIFSQIRASILGLLGGRRD
jgi:hypothetical protein